VRLRAFGARLDESLATEGGTLREEGVRAALLLFERAGLVLSHVPGDTLTAVAKKRASGPRGDDVIYRIPDEKRIVLDYAKNIIVHFFAPRALVAVALFSGEGPPAQSAVEARVQELSRLLKHELIFRADAPFERIFGETVSAMLTDGELVAQADTLLPGPGSLGWSGRAWLTFYAAIVRNFLESYRIAARAMRLTQAGPLAEKSLSDRALTVGEQMFLGGEIDRPEAVSRTVIDNAWSAFADLRWLTRREGKLSLAGPYAERPEGLEEEVSVYLRRRAIDAPF
jgi:glycerol-3-phosphate O-acyltransferase